MAELSPNQLAAITQAIEGRSSERVQRTAGWIPVVVTLSGLLVGATAFIAPLRDDIDRVEMSMAQFEQDNLVKIIRLSERIDGVQDDLESKTQDTAARLALIQADLSVIKAKLETER